MKKALFSFAIAVVATALVACGNKTAQNADGTDSATAEEQISTLKGETVDTRFYTIIIPENWKVKDLKTKDINLFLKRLKEDGSEDRGYMTLHVNEYKKYEKLHEPNEKKDDWVSRSGSRVDKGEMKFGKATYFVGQDTNLNAYELFTKLGADGVLQISVRDFGIDDETVKAIIENINIKETPDEKVEAPKEAITYKTEPGKAGFTRYFIEDGVSVELPENVKPREGEKNIFDEQEATYKTIYSATTLTLSDHFDQNEYMRTRIEGAEKIFKDAKVTKNGKNFDITYTKNTTITCVEHHITTPTKAFMVRVSYWNKYRDDKPEKYMKDVFNSMKFE
ncbi:MAG: hypothetical protein IJ633_02580 [Prevotella sp.]|nr:hypothetical protein [Prevotella sp.]